MSEFNSPDYQAIADADDAITAGYLLHLLTLKLSEQSDRIAKETESLRAIAQAAQLKKDCLATLSHFQAYKSRQALIESGEWDSIKEKFNIDLFVQNLNK